MKGNLGDDVYLWNLGDGNDTIDDVHGKSVLKFGAGISRENLRAIPVHVEENVWRSGIRPRSTTPPIPWRNAVRLVVGETGESVLIKNWPGVLLYDHGKVSGIEPIDFQVRFEDGTVLTTEDLKAMLETG